MKYFEDYFQYLLFKNDHPFLIFKKDIPMDDLLLLEIKNTYVKLEYIQDDKKYNLILKYKNDKLYKTLKYYQEMMIVTDKTNKLIKKINQSKIEKIATYFITKKPEKPFDDKMKKEIQKETKKNIKLPEEIEYKIYTFE